MHKILLALAVVAAPAQAVVIRNEMAVLSSDGVRVAVVNHVPNGEKDFGADEMFFTADPYYRLRRIYAREAEVTGGAVHLKMTAEAYKKRGQNPEG